MKEFLEKLVSYIIDPQSAFEVREENTEGLTTFTVFAPSQEVGKIIGKEGKVISAIRNLCRIKASREQKRVLIKVEQAS